MLTTKSTSKAKLKEEPGIRTGHSLVQVQKQTLTMTPELQQSIHILQLSSYELSQYLQEQALENPLLDIESFTSSYLKAGKSSQVAGFIISQILYGRQKRLGEETLEQWLLSQLRIAGVSDSLYQTAAYLAGNLDDRGYLPLSITEVSSFLNKPREVVEEALACIQSLRSPAGCRSERLAGNAYCCRFLRIKLRRSALLRWSANVCSTLLR